MKTSSKSSIRCPKCNRIGEDIVQSISNPNKYYCEWCGNEWFIKEEMQQQSQSILDEIEQVTSKQYNVKEELSKLSKRQQQVDFDMLKVSIENFKWYKPLDNVQYDNINLFFELLSKSSSFAHEAHKELAKNK